MGERSSSKGPNPTKGANGAHTPPRPPATPEDQRIRVLLVGRTHLDAALRADRDIELIRASSAINAIGELSDPIDESTPVRTVVVVGAESEPAGEIADFIANLRRVEPSARVLRAGDQAELHLDDAYDGLIDPALDAAGLRRVLRGTQTPDGPKGGSAAPERRSDNRAGARGDPASAYEPGAPSSGPDPGASRRGDPGAETGLDLTLIDALLTGREVLSPALEAIGRRTGCRDVIFVPFGSESEDPARPVAAAVAHGDRTLGELRARAADPAALAAAAAWLARWILLREQQQQLRRAAFTDDLTGAWNRRYFDRFLKAAIPFAGAQRQAVTVLCFDIDDFKKYNDRYGHSAGDEILRETVRLLKSVIRPTDRVCRIGGDEFAVVFHEPAGPRDPASKPPASVTEIAARFQRQICEHRFPKLAEGAPGTLTISGGLATYPWDGRTAEELLERADQLACESKRQGKNAITVGPGAARVCGDPPEK